jgi:uncharacterized protein YaiE (UPF0345 family)
MAILITNTVDLPIYAENSGEAATASATAASAQPAENAEPTAPQNSGQSVSTEEVTAVGKDLVSPDAGGGESDTGDKAAAAVDASETGSGTETGSTDTGTGSSPENAGANGTEGGSIIAGTDASVTSEADQSASTALSADTAASAIAATDEAAAAVSTEIRTEDRTVSLTGVCKADGQTIEGQNSFSIGFDGDSDSIDINAFAPSIEGYIYTGTATLNGDPVSQVRKTTAETKETVDGKETVTGKIISMQYSADPSAEGSWKDLTGAATIEFTYTKTEADAKQKAAALLFSCVSTDADGNEQTIEGYDRKEISDLSSFDTDLALDDTGAAPLSIDGYTYQSARIGSTVISALHKTVKHDDESGTDDTVYSYTADGAVKDLDADTTITLVYAQDFREAKLTVTCVDENGKTIDGHAKAEIPSFEKTLALDDPDKAPLSVDGYIYQEARLGGADGTVITSLSREVKKSGSRDITVYSYTADGKTVTVAEDTTITFRYTAADKVVKVNATCFDEFGDRIADKYTNIELPVFPENGLLKLDGDNAPVKDISVRKGLFKVVRYTYVQATIDGTIITGMRREKARTAKGSAETGYVYTYTTDGSVWTKITADTTVHFEYSDGSKTAYQYEDDNVIVTATLQHAGAIPDDAELKVTPVTADTAGYNYEAYMQALNDNADRIAEETGIDLASDGASAAAQDPEIAGKAADAAQKLNENNTLLYDIAFMADKTDEDGNVIEGEKEEYEPTEGMVKISMTFRKNQLTKELNASAADDVAVVHLPLDSAAKEDVSSTKDATNISASDVNVDVVPKEAASVNGTGSDQVDFDLSSFSITVLIGSSNIITGTTKIYTVNNNTYNYTTGHQTVYTVDKDADVYLNTATEPTHIPAGSTFAVPQKNSFKIVFSDNDKDLTLTLDAAATKGAETNNNTVCSVI